MYPIARHVRLVTVSLVIGASACSDSSGPSRRIDVTLTAGVIGAPAVTLDEWQVPQIECRVSVQAAARGVGAATWEDATIHFLVGGDRSAPSDTVPISATEVADIWDAPEISAGELRHVELLFTAPEPFAVTLSFRYRDGGRRKSAEAGFDCGPKLPSSSAPPSITLLELHPASGVIDPGQPFTVRFSGESGVGIVQSKVELAGACIGYVTLPEPLSNAVTRDVTIIPDFVCQTDIQVTVRLTLVDAQRRETTRTLAKNVTLEDRTPPTIDPVFPRDRVDPARTMDYFTGDRFAPDFRARDNYRLAWLVWEVLPSGVRDSVAVTGTGWNHASILVRPEWGVGPMQLRVHARDAAGLVSNHYTTEPTLIHVYPTATLPARATQLPGEVGDFAIDARRGVVYLMQRMQRRITVMALATMEVTRTIDLPGLPYDLDITPRGDSLVVTLSDTRALAIIDLREAAGTVGLVPLTILEAGIQQEPGLIRTASNGKALVTLRGPVPQAHRLAEVDFATGSQRLRSDWGDGSNMSMLAIERSHDGTAIIIQGGQNEFQRYDAPMNAFGPRRNAPGFRRRPTVDSTARRVAIGVDVYDELLLPLRPPSDPNLGPFPPSALSPDGEILYTIVGGNIVRRRVSDGGIIDRIVNPARFATTIRVSPDGAWIVTADWPQGALTNVSVVQLR